MGPNSSSFAIQAVATFAWLFLGATAPPGAAQEPSPATAAMPSLPDVVSSVEETVEPPVQPIDLAAWNGRTDVYPFGQVILESLFGQPDADTWRPLPLSTLFSEGWREPWVPSPSGSGGAPRQGWINAADGNLYRLWFFTFAQGFNQVPKGNAYLGSYTLFAPLSRRLDLIINIPFILRNSAVTGLPIIDPNNPPDADVEELLGIRRYLIHAPGLAVRDERLFAHKRTLYLNPDRYPASGGENDDTDTGRRVLE